jgi:uncharacterized repeat protein (TIGR01451 family)
MPLQPSGQMSFADVYNEMTGEQLINPPISITAAELGQLQNANGQTIPLNTNYTPRPNGNLPTVFPDEWYLYCQRCNTASPYITISKSAPSSASINTEFAYRIVIANNGQVNSSGDIVVSDTIPSGLTYVRFERDTPAWGVSVSGQNVTAIFSSTLPVGFGAVITIYVTTDVQATYSNYATVQGGGETITKTSNTVNTTVGGVPTFSGSVTKRLVRTFQKNDCGNYGVGSNQEVYSPFFTGTATSEISQADADSKANTNATNLCNTWLDDNGQSQANEYGTCSYDYPQMTLSKTMPSSFNLNQSGEVVITMRTLGASTLGEIVMYDDLPNGFEFVNLNSKPDIFTFTHINRSVTFRTSNSLSPGYFAEFRFLIRAITVGNYSNFASAYGGNILNNNATSNTVQTFVYGEPTFAFSVDSFNENFKFARPINAAPTDEAYYVYRCTIGNQPSTNQSLLAMRITIPDHYRIIDDVSVFINETYFFYSQGFIPNELLIFQKSNVTVPVGQYIFYVRINLVIQYYRMSSISQDELERPNDNLIINSNGQVVPRRQFTNFKGFVGGTQVHEDTRSIDWANNYQFLATATCRDTNQNNVVPIDSNNLTWAYQINGTNNFSQQFPLTYDSGINVFTAVGNMYALNPTRDSKLRQVNSDYPYQTNGMFSIRIYYRIYHEGRHITSAYVNPGGSWVQIFEAYEEVNIDKIFNEPKLRNLGFKLILNPNGTYRYWPS